MNAADTIYMLAPFTQLHGAAASADQALAAAVLAALRNTGTVLARIAPEATSHDTGYLAVSPAFGPFLYATARAHKVRRIVEFGTSMGVSTTYLATALRDNGGGQLIGTELVPAKAARARMHLEAAGFADLVEIRSGDARATLQDVGAGVDLVLLDGESDQYLAVLLLLEPALAPGAVILADNALDPDYRDYVRNPANGYRSAVAPLDDGRCIELTTWIGA
ncbi:MAG: class I SAM-dependent methyltransferase [Pseudomonadota bacterium]|nr:class I SAM-dependent methyltransferase [Pseudomonadota bacterium]